MSKKQKKIKTRTIIAMFACFVLLFVSAGCDNDQTEAPAEEPDPQQGHEEQETAEQIIVIGEQFDLRSYDPSGPMSDFVRALVFNTLIELDLDFKQTPGLAESWEMSENGLRWELNLRQGVQFHDGTPWNAEAAKTNLDWQIDGPGASWLSYVDNVEIVDDYTIALNLATPAFTLPSDLTPPFLSMISPAAIDDEGDVTAAIGTGPFKLASWTQDSEFVMERNDDYFDGAPILDKVIFKVIPDAETRAMALESGQVDMMSGREGLTVVQRFADSDEINIAKKMGQTSELLFFNVYRQPFDDINVREAVAYAIDFSELVPTLLGDMAEPPISFFSPAYGEFVSKDISFPDYNPVKSMDLLAEAGWELNDSGIHEKDGQELSVTLYYASNNEEDKLLCAAIQGLLSEVGITVELRAVEPAALRETFSEKDFDMLMIGQWFVPHDDPTTHYLRGYWHSNSVFTVYTSPELDQKVEELFASLDREERLELHHAIQEDVVEQVAFLPVFHRNNVVLMHEKVSGFKVSTGTWQIFRGLVETRIE